MSQYHVSVALLPHKECWYSSEVGWGPDPVRTLRRRPTFFCLHRKSNRNSSFDAPATTATELARLLLILVFAIQNGLNLKSVDYLHSALFVRYVDVGF